MTQTELQRIQGLIRDVPDFPKPGIVFKDITPLLLDGGAFRAVVKEMARRAAELGPDCVVAIESRGFIFGSAVAAELGIGFVPIRKPGKLPWRTRRVEYALEYGTDAIEMHEDALEGKGHVLVMDDLLATGGTARAACQLVEEHGARVSACQFLVELSFLEGRKKLDGYAVDALIAY